MSFLFKNYSLIETTYLLIRFHMSILNMNLYDYIQVLLAKDKEYREILCKWAKDIHTTQRKIILQKVRVKISGTPSHFRIASHFTNPSLFIGKIWTLFFRENFESSNLHPLPFLKGLIMLIGFAVKSNRICLFITIRVKQNIQ